MNFKRFRSPSKNWLILGALLAFGQTERAVAQDTLSQGPLVVFAIADDFQFQGAEAVILRRTALVPADVVLMKKSKATALLIETSLDQLAVLRTVDGDKPTKSATYRVGLPKKARAKSPKAKLRDEEFSKIVLSMILQTEPKPLEGVGNVSYVEIRPRRQVISPASR